MPRACPQLPPARYHSPGASLGARRARQHHMWCFALLPAPYSGAKELSYPACRRLGPDGQAQGRVVKPPTPGQPTSYQPKYDEPDAVMARSLFDCAGTGGRLPPLGREILVTAPPGTNASATNISRGPASVAKTTTGNAGNAANL